MKNYAKGKPMGNNQIPFYDSPPPVEAIAVDNRTTAATAGVSSITVLNANTTAIEVLASGAPAFLKWLTQSVVDSSVAGTSVIASGTTANFDGMIAKDTIRRFIVPISTVTTAPPGSYGAPQGANKDNNLYPNVAIIGGNGSVMTLQN